METNGYGDVDVRYGVPPDGVRVGRLPAPEEVLAAAGVAYGRALVGFKMRRRHRAVISGWVIDRD
ncbi:MAG: hypothetical protein K2X87_16220 [Gemmataceae bacterium]|nr:hypothetical protein [Gemmataceae bacterium]